MTTYAAFPLAESFASSLSSHEERRADFLKRLRVCCLFSVVEFHNPMNYCNTWKAVSILKKYSIITSMSMLFHWSKIKKFQTPNEMILKAGLNLVKIELPLHLFYSVTRSFVSGFFSLNNFSWSN
jgi:hypothetical protein